MIQLNRYERKKSKTEFTARIRISLTHLTPSSPNRVQRSVTVRGPERNDKQPRHCAIPKSYPKSPIKKKIEAHQKSYDSVYRSDMGTQIRPLPRVYAGGHTSPKMRCPPRTARLGERRRFTAFGPMKVTHTRACKRVGQITTRTARSAARPRARRL